MISAQLLANTRRLAAAARAEKGEGMGWCVPTGSKQAPSPIPTHPTSPPSSRPHQLRASQGEPGLGDAARLEGGFQPG